MNRVFFSTGTAHLPGCAGAGRSCARRAVGPPSVPELYLIAGSPGPVTGAALTPERARWYSLAVDWFNAVLVVVGLSLFEGVSSLDNAIINAEVLRTMGEKARRWFLVWGIFFAVFVVRGVLPWLILFVVNPELGLWGSLTATFSNDPRAAEAIARSAPILLMGGGIFLVFLFFHWLFLEPKKFGLAGERFFLSQGVWFYAVVSVLLSLTVWMPSRRTR